MDINTLWFIVIAFLFTGYFVLEGFDFGVGMLLPFVGGDSAEANDRRRTAQIKTIGPVWDGNEVWLITAGGSLFAAFPEWYSTMFSGFYLPFLLILVALIGRGVAIEWRGKVDSFQWRRRCDTVIAIGSYVPAILWGNLVVTLVTGLPLNASGRIESFTSIMDSLFTIQGILGAVAFTLLFALHGAFFIGFKAHDPLRQRMHAIAKRVLSLPALLTGVALALLLQLTHGVSWTWVAFGTAGVALIAAVFSVATGKDKSAFTSTTVAIIAVSVLVFGSLFPNVIPSTNEHAGWDIYNAASSPYTLSVMSWAALFMVPLVLIAQGWTYWSFRKRVKV